VRKLRDANDSPIAIEPNGDGRSENTRTPFAP